MISSGISLKDVRWGVQSGFFTAKIAENAAPYGAGSSLM